MSLYVWGKNSHGQLGMKPARGQFKSQRGHHTVEEGEHPASVSTRRQSANASAAQGQAPTCVEVDNDRFVAAAAGEHHTLVITQYGDVKTFGRGREGQLGHGEGLREDENVPRKVEGLSDMTVVAAACGAFHSLAVTSSGLLYEWGLIHTERDIAKDEGLSNAELLALAGPSRMYQDPSSHLSTVVADSARRWLAATDVTDREEETSSSEDDRVDKERELMQKHMMARLPTRKRQSLPRLATSLQGVRVTSVSAGYAHSVAVTADGRAFASGQNDRGQLGLGHRIHSGAFREVVGMADRFVLEVACGEQHNLARVTASGKASSGAQAELYVWGGGRLGQLGLGAASTRLSSTHNAFLGDVGGGVVSVSAGANHSVCAVASGLVYGWGHAEYNQQGVAVVAGADLMGEGEGYGFFRVPQVVRGLAGTHVVSVHCGSNFTLAVDRKGVTHSFGWNEGDALGRGWQGAYDSSPWPVPSLPGVVSIAAGSRHAAAVTAEGPPLGRHLRGLVDDAELADVILEPPDAAASGNSGVAIHMSVLSVRSPYIMGYARAALSDAREEATDEQQEGTKKSFKTVQLFLEHATVDTVPLLARYLYTDEVPAGVPGRILVALMGLAGEVMLPRLEALCTDKLPDFLRRRYELRKAGDQLAMAGLVSVPISTFAADLGRLPGRREHSDVDLVVPEWDWKLCCHKAILCVSPWWHALLMGGFREGGGDVVDISGLLHDGVTRKESLEAAIRHIYTNSPSTVAGMDPSVVMEVVMVAEFMNLPSLKSACQSELSEYVDVDNALFLSHFADRRRTYEAAAPDTFRPMSCCFSRPCG